MRKLGIFLMASLLTNMPSRKSWKPWNLTISGASPFGWEPFEPENQAVLVGVLRHVREHYPQKTIWCYSGYLFDERYAERALG